MVTDFCISSSVKVVGRGGSVGPETDQASLGWEGCKECTVKSESPWLKKGSLMEAEAESRLID